MKMKRTIFISLSLVFVLLLGACAMNFSHKFPTNYNDQTDSSIDHSRRSMMRHGMHGHGSSSLRDSTGKNELKIPPLLENDKVEGENIYYTIEAQKGKTELFYGIFTETLGYNGPFLGPVISLQKGQTAHFTLKNNLDEETTFHWHGLIINGEDDGGPHDVLQPGEVKEITFNVQQDRSTLWFHPHPLGKTAKQVYEGLAGLLFIEDDPFEYGKNDFPIVLQDRTFTRDQQLDYERIFHPDGTLGEFMLINRTLHPKLTVGREKVRL